MAKQQTVDPSKLKATPEQEDFAHKYTEEGSGKVGGGLINNYFKKVEELVQQTGLTSGTAIELGCGEGFSTERLRGLLPAGIELQASEYVADLVPKAQAKNPNVKVFQESVYELTHADNSFDIIFLLEVLEHLDYPDKALAEIARVLKPDGYLILGVPREPLWCCLNMARGKYLAHLGNTPGHLNHWSTFTLKRYIQKHFGPLQAVKTPLPWTLVSAQNR